MEELNDQLFCRIGDYADDGYLVYDWLDSKFLYQNEALSHILGMEGRKVPDNINSILALIYSDDINYLKSKITQLKNNAIEKFDFRINVNGEERYLKASVGISMFTDRKVLTAILEDTTISQHNKIHIEQINARKNVTLEVLSHDIKEPMAMIKLIVSSLVNDIADDENRIKKSLHFISEMCERNLTLIRSMVNHEFLKSSVTEIEMKRADLVWEIQDVVRFYKRSHLSKSRVFDFSASDEKIYLEVDSIKFMQVVNNLISNAIKFTHEGGQISVDVQDRGDSVRVSVSDDGIGIPENIRSRIFEADKKVLREGLEGQPSGGLGLGIAKKLVELHNGKISLVSEEGVGTTFFIDLPKHH